MAQSEWNEKLRTFSMRSKVDRSRHRRPLVHRFMHSAYEKIQQTRNKENVFYFLNSFISYRSIGPPKTFATSLGSLPVTILCWSQISLGFSRSVRTPLNLCQCRLKKSYLCLRIRCRKKNTDDRVWSSIYINFSKKKRKKSLPVPIEVECFDIPTAMHNLSFLKGCTMAIDSIANKTVSACDSLFATGHSVVLRPKI